MDKWHSDFYRGSANAYSTLWWLLWLRVALNPSQVIQISNLSVGATTGGAQGGNAPLMLP
jgi:hypothetical protein